MNWEWIIHTYHLSELCNLVPLWCSVFRSESQRGLHYCPEKPPRARGKALWMKLWRGVLRALIPYYHVLMGVLSCRTRPSTPCIVTLPPTSASSPNHCSSGRRCNRHILSAISLHWNQVNQVRRGLIYPPNDAMIHTCIHRWCQFKYINYFVL